MRFSRLLFVAGLVFSAGATSQPAERPAARAELLGPGVLSTGDDDAHATFSPDGTRVYFIKNSPDFAHWTILVAKRQGDGFLEPEVAPFSGRHSDADLSFAPDGQTIYLVSTRPVPGELAARDDTEIWRMRRTGETWGEPEHVAELSSPGNEWFPNATADGWLYFGSERSDRNLGAPGTSDLWRARLRNGRYDPPENLGDRLNTRGNDIEPWISADGRLLVFASSGRADTHGSYDLYASRRCGDEWTEPKNLGNEVNSAGWDFGGRPTPDGRWFVFTSNRARTSEPYERQLSYAELLGRIRSPGNGLRDIYRIELASLDFGPPCPAGSP
jgi:Tol biopolymer transport system component